MLRPSEINQRHCSNGAAQRGSRATAVAGQPNFVAPSLRIDGASVSAMLLNPNTIGGREHRSRRPRRGVRASQINQGRS
jgi:hypothetical protein